MNKNQQQTNKNGTIDYEYMLSMLWKHAALLILSGVLVGALAFSYARVAIASRYEASVLFFVNSSSVNLSNVLQVSTGSRVQKVGNYLAILKARTTLEEVIEKSGVKLSYKTLRNMIKATTLADTDLIQVTVNAGDPESARTLANAIAEVLPDRVTIISASTSLEVVDYAETPESRVSPNYITYAEYGFVGGVAIAALIILAIAFFDNIIRDADYCEQTYQVPVIAEIPDLTEKGSGRYGYGYGYGYGPKPKKTGDGKTDQEKKAAKKLSKEARQTQAMLCDNLSFAATEAYKRLRTNLMFSLPEKPCRILGVTSSVRGEGKSTTAVNLSYSFAQAGKRVLLIDADMRLPSIDMKLAMARSPGLSNLLVGMNSEKECLRDSGKYDNWKVLPSGDVPPNPLELLGSERMHVLLDHYAGLFDYIIMDLPPVNIVADSLVASKWTDGIITIVREKYTDRNALKASMTQIQRLNVKLLGFVMTFVSAGGSAYKKYGKYGGKYGKYGYGYGYGYGSGKSEEQAFEGTDQERKNWEFLDAVENDLTPKKPRETPPDEKKN